VNGTRPAPVPADAEPLPDDASVDLSSERKRAAVDEILDSLDRELVGLVPVKTRIREIAALLLVDRVRARFGLAAQAPSLHMCFTGNPGTGKTTVALRMAELLHRLGYLRSGHVVSVTRDDLVGQYVGHTAPKTKDVLKRAMGGVLFIDEAYYLYRAENERDYGAESIEILLQYMENHRDDLVVILAGYADRMETFFASNPGMSSRIAHHLEFPDYTLDDQADDPAPVCQRAQRPQRARARPPPARQPPGGRLRHARQGRPHAAGARRLPLQPGIQRLKRPTMKGGRLLRYRLGSHRR